MREIVNIIADARLDVTRLTKPFSRRALQRRNLTYFAWRYVANGIRTGRALLMRRSHLDTAIVARELKSEGIAVGPSGSFLTDEGQNALEEAGEQILKTTRTSDGSSLKVGGATGKKEFLVDLVTYPEGVSPDDPLLRVALDRKLLEAVSGYFGMWPCLYSVSAWLNYATDTPPQLSQLWHRDPGDLKVVKVFIYLSDVDESCGPFSYIPRTQPFGEANGAARKLEQKKRVTDDLMARYLPPESWRVCTGEAGTMIVADTVGYHRGGKPMAGHHRILVTFTYMSATPMDAPSLRVRSMPAWATGIQRAVVRPLLPARPAT